MQEWKAKINGFFQPKSQAERQKMMKYVIVMPAAILSGIVILWLLYSGLKGDEPKTGNAFNTEIPDGENDGIKSKAEEYAAAEVAKEKEQRQVAIANLDTLSSQSPDTVVQSSAIETSAQTYQEVQASLDDFFIPENTEASQVAELQARIDELEAQNAMAQQPQQPDQMEMLERSYQLAAQYMGNGNGGNYQAPQQQDDEKGKRNVQPVAQVSRNVVSSLGSSSDRSFNTSVGTKSVTTRNTIAAVVAGNQSVIDGESVKLRTTEPMWIGNRLIPRNTTITGSGRVQGERLEIEITSIECDGSIFEVEKLWGTGLKALGVSMFLGLLVCYAFGTAWFMFLYTKNTGPVGLWTVLGWCVIPYIIPDLVKIAVALGLTARLRRHVK